MLLRIGNIERNRLISIIIPPIEEFIRVLIWLIGATITGRLTLLNKTTSKEMGDMSQIKGPALFLAQFAQDIPPYNTLENITRWAGDLGFVGVQIPANDPRLIDLDKAAESKQYCDDLKGKCNGLAITELATHLLGQLVAVHPAYDVQFDAFAPKE